MVFYLTTMEITCGQFSSKVGQPLILKITFAQENADLLELSCC